jgi:hypothetical protein
MALSVMLWDCSESCEYWREFAEYVLSYDPHSDGGTQADVVQG